MKFIYRRFRQLLFISLVSWIIPIMMLPKTSYGSVYTNAYIKKNKSKHLLFLSSEKNKTQINHSDIYSTYLNQIDTVVNDGPNVQKIKTPTEGKERPLQIGEPALNKMPQQEEDDESPIDLESIEDKDEIAKSKQTTYEKESDIKRRLRKEQEDRRKSGAKDTLNDFGVSLAEIRLQKKRAESEEAILLSRLFPADYMKVAIGEYITDSLFSRYNTPQLETIIDGKTSRIQYLKMQNDRVSGVVLQQVRSFFEDFQETKMSDDILIRYMELLYENVTVSYVSNRRVYEQLYQQYLASNEYISYKDRLKEYYRSKESDLDTLEVKKPQPPVPPQAPDPKLDDLLEIYDRILNNLKDERYLPHVLFAKAYVLGERYKDYKEFKNLKDIDIDQKRQEAITVFNQLLQKFPNSKYAVQAYLLTGEYLFNSIRRQPRRTIESIPYYQKAIQYIVERNQDKEFYERVLYKLAWANFRVDYFKDALSWFNFLMEDIEKNEELYSGKPMPENVLLSVKDEVLQNMAECFMRIQKLEDNTKSAADMIVSNYRTSIKYQIRRFIPLLYQKLGEFYELSAEFEKVQEVYSELLRRYPNYEMAPYITQKLIDLLNIMASNGELEGSTQAMVDNQLYEERKKLIYRYGKGTIWYDNLKSKIEAQKRGITLPFEERSIAPTGFNPKILIIADSLGKAALFKNIIDGVSKAQLYEGGLNQEVGVGSKSIVDKKKAMAYYLQVVRDIDNYLTSYTYFDSTSFFVGFQKAQILHFKLGKPWEAAQAYMNLAKNFAYDSMVASFDIPNSPRKSYRKEVMDLAYTLVEDLTKSAGTGFYTAGLDTLTRFPAKEQPLQREEVLLVDVLDDYMRLFPHDSLSVKVSQLLLSFYLSKGYVERYKDLMTKLIIFYPVQNVSIEILTILAKRDFEIKNFKSAEMIAKAVYKSPYNNSKSEKEIKLKQYNFNLIGASIAAGAEEFAKERKFKEAAKEYERIVTEIPSWENASLAAQLAANNYANAGMLNEAVRMNKRLIRLSKSLKVKLIGFSGLLYAYQKSNMLDSVAGILEEISDTYLKDSASLADNSLFDAIRISEQNERFKESIRLSDKYIQRYPKSERTYQVVFNKISLSKKLGDLQSVFTSYGQFADNYKDNALSVEAYFRRGDFAEEKGDLKVAVEEYQKAVERNKILPKEKSNPLFAAEALYRVNRQLYFDYTETKIKVVVPASIFHIPDPNATPSKTDIKKEQISFDVTQKNDLYSNVKKNLFTTIELGGFRSILAFYKVGQISQELADSYGKLPVELREYTNEKGSAIPIVKLVETIAQANVEASFFYNRSGLDYIFVWDKLKSQKSKIEEKRKEEAKNKKQIVNTGLTEKSYEEMQTTLASYKNKQMNLNTALDNFEKSAVKWVMNTSSTVPLDILILLVEAIEGNSKDAGFDNMFKAAELQEQNFKMYSKIEVPEEIKTLEKKIGKGKNQVKVFLGDVQELNFVSSFVSARVRPFAKQSIIAYDSLMKKMQTYNLGQGTDKAQKIDDKIMYLVQAPAAKMDSLVKVSQRYFEDFENKYEAKLMEIDAVGKQTSKDVVDLVIYKVKMQQLIQVINTLTTQTLEEFASGYKALKDLRFDETKLSLVGNAASRFIFDVGKLDFETHKKLKTKFEKYNNLANKFFEKDWLSVAAQTYDPLQSLYLNLTQNVLGQIVILMSEYGIQNEYTAKSIQALVETDRAKYLSFLGSEAIKDTVFKGNWKYKTVIPEDDSFEWYKKDYAKAVSWSDAVQNEEKKMISFIVAIDTSYTLKSYDAPSYWYRKKTRNSDIVVAEAKDPLEEKFKGVFSEIDHVFDLSSISFNTKNEIIKNADVLQDVGKYLAKKKNIYVEITINASELKEKNAKKRRASIIARGEKIKTELEILGVNQMNIVVGNTDTKSQKTRLRVMKVESTDGKSSSILENGKKDSGKLLIKKQIENYASQNQNSEYVYMRSEFSFSDAIKFAQLVLAKETSLDSMELYFNDIFLDLKADRVITTPQMKYHYDENKQLIFDITNKLVRGRNIIAIKMPTNLRSEGIKLIAQLTYYGAVTDKQLKKLTENVLESRKKAQKELKDAQAKQASESE